MFKRIRKQKHVKHKRPKYRTFKRHKDFIEYWLRRLSDPVVCERKRKLWTRIRPRTGGKPK